MNLHDRMVPQSREAERSLLGGILRNPGAFHHVGEIVTWESFYHDAHQSIFRAMFDLSQASAPIDLSTIHEKLKAGRQIENVGGVRYLVELWEAEPTGANCEFHASVIREHWLRRKLIHVMNEILRDAYDQVAPALEMVSESERKVMAIAELTVTSANLISAREMLAASLERIDRRVASGGKMVGLSTGYFDIDRVLAGLHNGEVLTIGARPSLGKTALAMNIASRVSLAGNAVLFFSVEMAQEQIADRLLSLGSGVSLHKINSGNQLDSDEIDKLTLAASPNGIGGCELFVDDCTDMSPDRILHVSRRAVRKFNIKLIIVDYLQLLRPTNSKAMRTEQVGDLARRMKLLARELKVPVICLAQLNRESEAQGGRPKLSHLRDSGEIEQHTDSAILLHREPNDTTPTPGTVISAIIAKNRNGPTEEVKLTFFGSVMKFENNSPEW